MVYYLVDTRVVGVSKATDLTFRLICILMPVTNVDGGGTVIKSQINKNAIYFCVSCDRSRISW